MSKYHWEIMNDIIIVLKSLDIAITTLCSENGITISLIFFIIHIIKNNNNHFKINDIGRSETEQFKSILVTFLINRFKLNSNIEIVHDLVSFLNPRRKQLSFKIMILIPMKKNFITVAISNIIENIQIIETIENAIFVLF